MSVELGLFSEFLEFVLSKIVFYAILYFRFVLFEIFMSPPYPSQENFFSLTLVKQLIIFLLQSLNTVLYSNDPADLPLTDLDAAASLPYDTDIPDGKYQHFFNSSIMIMELRKTD